MSFHINHSTRTVPSLPFQKIKEDILGARYDLSLVFVGDVRSRRLNKTYRNKTYIPNVLSFPLDATTGEIFINTTQARREAKKFSMSDTGFVGFLFIHGLLHLKGYAHGATMEKAESRYKIKYTLA